MIVVRFIIHIHISSFQTKGGKKEDTTKASCIWTVLFSHQHKKKKTPTQKQTRTVQQQEIRRSLMSFILISVEAAKAVLLSDNQ